MLDLIKFTCSFLLILLLFIVFYLNYKVKNNKKVNQKNFVKYPIFFITNFFLNSNILNIQKKGN